MTRLKAQSRGMWSLGQCVLHPGLYETFSRDGRTSDTDGALKTPVVQKVIKALPLTHFSFRTAHYGLFSWHAMME